MHTVTKNKEQEENSAKKTQLNLKSSFAFPNGLNVLVNFENLEKHFLKFSKAVILFSWNPKFNFYKRAAISYT